MNTTRDQFDKEVARQFAAGRKTETTGKAAWKSCPECANRYRAGQKAGHVAAGHVDWFDADK